jgi:hypothetical protein
MHTDTQAYRIYCMETTSVQLDQLIKVKQDCLLMCVLRSTSTIQIYVTFIVVKIIWDIYSQVWLIDELKFNLKIFILTCAQINDCYSNAIITIVKILKYTVTKLSIPWF